MLKGVPPKVQRALITYGRSGNDERVWAKILSAKLSHTGRTCHQTFMGHQAMQCRVTMGRLRLEGPCSSGLAEGRIDVMGMMSDRQ